MMCLGIDIHTRFARMCVCSMYSTRCVRFASKFLRNEQIIHDEIKLFDSKKRLIGEMTIQNAIELAHAKKMDIVHKIDDTVNDKPECFLLRKGAQYPGYSLSVDGPPKDSIGFSFDPTGRVSTIQMSAAIASEEFEMKLDILRKHLGEKRRCELVILNAKSDADIFQIKELVKQVLEEVRDIAKLASDIESFGNSKYVCKIWPCTPEQTIYTELTSY